MSASRPGVPPELTPAGPALLREHRAALVDLARHHGLSRLRVTGTGRLLVSIDGDHDYFDLFDFERAAAQLVGAAVEAVSDGVLRNPGPASELVAAEPL